jgi:hypothetical protein
MPNAAPESLDSGTSCRDLLLTTRGMPQPLYDNVDRAILQRLQLDGRTPNVDLAGAVHLSTTSWLRRTKALEADGVIAGYRADRVASGSGCR